MTTPVRGSQCNTRKWLKKGELQVQPLWCFQMTLNIKRSKQTGNRQYRTKLNCLRKAVSFFCILLSLNICFLCIISIWIWTSLLLNHLFFVGILFSIQGKAWNIWKCEETSPGGPKLQVCFCEPALSFYSETPNVYFDTIDIRVILCTLGTVCRKDQGQPYRLWAQSLPTPAHAQWWLMSLLIIKNIKLEIIFIYDFCHLNKIWLTLIHFDLSVFCALHYHPNCADTNRSKFGSKA